MDASRSEVTRLLKDWGDGRQEALDNQWATTAQIAQWQSEASAEIEEAVAVAQKDATPDPTLERWTALATAHLAEGITPATS